MIEVHLYIERNELILTQKKENRTEKDKDGTIWTITVHSISPFVYKVDGGKTELRQESKTNSSMSSQEKMQSLVVVGTITRTYFNYRRNGNIKV